MKLQTLDDFDIPKDVIKNPALYVLIDGIYYKKTDPSLIQLKNGSYEKYSKDKHVKDVFSNEYIYMEEAATLIFKVKGGEVSFLYGGQNTFHLSSNVNELFRSSDVRKQLNIDIPESDSVIHVINPQKKDIHGISIANTHFYIFLSQADELGIKRSLATGEHFFINELDKKHTSKLKNTYISYEVKKKAADLVSLNMIGRNDLSFGVEIETSHGLVLPSETELLNIDLKCERDGSVTGGEYVTGVLNMDRGFYDLYKAVQLISRNCDTDLGCGIHVHIGGLYFNKQYTNLAYLLGYKLQNQIFHHFLHATRNANLMCGHLETSLYSKGVDVYKSFPLKTANDLYFEFLYKKMTYGQKLSRNLNKKHRHPGGRYCSRYQQFNGNITSDQFRYKWLNLIACNFNQKGSERRNDKLNHKSYTLEFRPLHATLNFEEIKDWVLFCMSFSLYIVNNPGKIMDENYEITLKEVTAMYPGLFERMSKREKIINSKMEENALLSFPKFCRKYKTIKNVPHTV